MSARRPDAVVVGAGVVGLTTGICLAEAGLRVRIRTAAVPAQTASAVAGALIGPGFTAPGHLASNVVTAWERIGISEFTTLAADPRTGAHLGRGRLAARPAAVEGGTPPLPEVAQVRLCEPGKLPDGFSFRRLGDPAAGGHEPVPEVSHRAVRYGRRADPGAPG